MKVLAVSNLVPRPGAEFFGIFVRREVLALRALGVEVEELEVSYRQSPLTSWAAFRARVQESGADLVNVYFGSIQAFGAALACPRPLSSRSVARTCSDGRAGTLYGSRW